MLVGDLWMGGDGQMRLLLCNLMIENELKYSLLVCYWFGILPSLLMIILAILLLGKRKFLEVRLYHEFF